MPREWQPIVSEFSDVMRLVHLAARLDDTDAESIREAMLRERRRIYEEELTAQTARVGCDGNAQIGEGPILSELNELAALDGDSIVNTFNFDLAHAIQRISAQTPTANRHVYAARLGEWEQKRAEWKGQQIAQWVEGQTRSKAQKDFFANNGIGGFAELTPATTAEPICRGWVQRGRVPLQEAMDNPPPYHPGCPHIFVTYPADIDGSECDDLWLGG